VGGGGGGGGGKSSSSSSSSSNNTPSHSPSPFLLLLLLLLPPFLTIIGGLIQSFLTYKFWVPLSGLSYTIYLVHYTVLTYWTSQRTLRVRWAMFDFINLFFGLTAISCGLALMVVMLVERPFMKLQKYYLEGGNKKKVVKAPPAMATPPPAPAKVVS